MLEDISARKNAEQALLEAKEELERKVHDRTWQLQNANALLRMEIIDHKRTVMTLRDSEVALRRLAAHQESVREEERKRMARELHDDLGGLLGGISANTSVVIKRMAKAGYPVEPLLEEILDQATTAFNALRTVISELRPGVLDQIGLWAAVEWYASKLQKQTEVKFTCIFEEPVEELELEGERSTAVFRIVQEALNNVVRHAQASRATVRARIEAGSVVVEVEDDGCGIEERRASQRACWGMVGMDERARYFGGDLSTGPARPMQKRHGRDRRKAARAAAERRSNRPPTRSGTRVQLRLPIGTGGVGQAE